MIEHERPELTEARSEIGKAYDLFESAKNDFMRIVYANQLDKAIHSYNQLIGE